MEGQLNPKIFNSSDVMIPEVRKSLLEVSSEFLKTICENSNICIDPVDIVLVGSNASYTYTDYSDIDLHIIVNFDWIDGDPDSLIQSYYNAEKNNFNIKYDFNIKGIDVEVYVEDIGQNTVSNGIYSVLNDRWIKFPQYVSENTESYDLDVFDDVYNEVQSALSSGSVTQVKYTIDQLYLLRKYGLSNGGEHSNGNLIFKEIRNMGLLDELKDEYYKLISNEISVR